MKSLNKFCKHYGDKFTEFYTLLLFTVGLPAIAYVYFDWRAALAVFVISQLCIGILALRSDVK